jgi:hypothetical protein
MDREQTIRIKDKNVVIAVTQVGNAVWLASAVFEGRRY